MNTSTTTEPPADNNSASTLLAELNRGRVQREFNDTFTGLVRSVRQHGKPGELMLKIKLAPAQGSNAHQVTVSASIAAKAPTAPTYAAIYFTTEDGKVQKNDPDQDELPFTPRALPAAPQPEPVRIPETAATQ